MHSYGQQIPEEEAGGMSVRLNVNDGNKKLWKLMMEVKKGAVTWIKVRLCTNTLSNSHRATVTFIHIQAYSTSLGFPCYPCVPIPARRSSKSVNWKIDVLVLLSQPCLGKSHHTALFLKSFWKLTFLEFTQLFPKRLNISQDNRGQGSCWSLSAHAILNVTALLCKLI